MTKERIATLASKLSQPDGVIRGKEMLQLLALARWALEAKDAFKDIVEMETLCTTDTRKSFLQEDCEAILAKFPGKDLER